MQKQKENLENNNTGWFKEIYLIKKISIVDKYNFYEYLWVMVDSWIILSEALDSVNSKIKNPYFNKKIIELLTYINSWDSFSKAMKKMPDVFDFSEISIIEAWETIWALSQSMIKLSDNLKRKFDLVSKIKWALTYPIIIFLFLIVAVIIILVYVIPAIRPLFENSWVELPAATKALIFTSDFIINNYLILILFIFSIWVFFVWYKSTNSWKTHIDSIKLSLPLIWRVYKNYILAQVASTFWILIWSWVWVVKALTLTWKSTNNIIYENIFKYVTIKVSKWEKIVDSIKEIDKENEYFSNDFTQMLSVWEQTANLEWITNKINTQYTKEVDYSIANLTKWVEPIAILIAWLFVVWFALAVFGAILKVTDTVW